MSLCSAIVQLQQFGNFIQAKAQLLCRFDEAHPRHVRIAIAANAPQRFVGLWQQALALVEADGFYIDTGSLGKSANRETVLGVIRFFLQKGLTTYLTTDLSYADTPSICAPFTFEMNITRT